MATKRTHRIKTGTKVTWTSQAGGYSKTKTGVILGFCPKDPWGVTSGPHRSFPTPKDWASRHGITDLNSRRVRTDFFRANTVYDRYAIKVMNGPRSKPRIYAPNAGTIERQNPNAPRVRVRRRS